MPGSHITRVFGQIRQIHERGLRVGGAAFFEQGPHGRGIESDAVFVDAQFDAVQVGLEPGLQDQAGVDAFFERVVALLQEVELLLREADVQRLQAGVDHADTAATGGCANAQP
ncbi:MAG: hypothetical protein FWF12_11970, partial [Betaproteobacteria bacterium]|nr:hypothetical protein [Betaproteobacteria bacterium]